MTPVTGAAAGVHGSPDELIHQASSSFNMTSPAVAPTALLTKSSKLISNGNLSVEGASTSIQVPVASQMMAEEYIGDAGDASPREEPAYMEQGTVSRNVSALVGQDNNVEKDDDEDSTGINVRSDNVYKDTGLSVREGDYSSVPTSTFDYLYEFSETRKVLEEFFKCPTFELEEDEKFADKLSESECDSIDIRYEFRASGGQCESRKSPRRSIENLDSGSPTNCSSMLQHIEADDPDEDNYDDDEEALDNEADVEDEANNDDPMVPLNRRRGFDLSISSMGRPSPEMVVMTQSMMLPVPLENGGTAAGLDKNGQMNPYFRYSPETTDYDSNCGDLDSLSGDFNAPLSMLNYQAYMRQCYASMPVLEDGLSSGHASDAENNNTERTGIKNGLRNNLHEEALNHGKDTTISPTFDNFPTTSSSLTGGGYPIIPPTLTNTLASIRKSGMSLPDATNVTPIHHSTEKQQQMPTDNHYLNAPNKPQPLINTCIGGAADNNLEAGVGDLQADGVGAAYEMGGNNNSAQNCNRYNGDGLDGGAQLNDSLNSVPDIHHMGVDRNKSTFTGIGTKKPMQIRDENLNPIDINDGMLLNNKRGLNINPKIFKNTDPDLESLYSINKFQSNGEFSNIY